MAKLFFRLNHNRTGCFLVPSDERSYDTLRKYKDGDIITATIRKPRNPRHHAKMFALLTLVRESTAIQDVYKTNESLLDALKHALNHVELFQAVDGTFLTKPKSINFESLDQAAFSEFYDGVVEIVCTQLVPHLNREDLERRVMELVK